MSLSSADFEQLRAALTREKRLGKCFLLREEPAFGSTAAAATDVVAASTGPADQARLNGLLLREAGLQAPDPIDWQPLPPAQAAALWERLLTRSQAYASRLLSAIEAGQYWQQFSALAGPKARYFTNLSSVADFRSGSSYGFASVAEATFSAAVFALSPGQALGFVITDED